MDEFDREKTLGAGAEEPVDSTRDDHSTPQHREQPLPWYRTPSTVINLMTVVVTLSLGLMTYFSDEIRAQWAKRGELSRLVERLAELDLESISLASSGLSQEHLEHAAFSVANRRQVVLRRIDEFLDEDGLEGELSGSELAVIGAGYANAGEYEPAKIYFEQYADEAGSLTHSAVLTDGTTSSGLVVAAMPEEWLRSRKIVCMS